MQPDPRLSALDLRTLIGLPVAEAQDAVAAAGGTARTVAPGQPVTLEFRPDRITLVVVAGEVIDATGPA